MYAATLPVAAASALPASFFVKRVWLFVPVFTGIVLMPATLSVVNAGDVVLTLWHRHGQAEGTPGQILAQRELLLRVNLIHTRTRLPATDAQ